MGYCLKTGVTVVNFWINISTCFFIRRFCCCIRFKLYKAKSLVNLYEYFFGEDQGRYIIEIENQYTEKVTKILNDNSVFFEKIGITQKEKLTLDHEFEVSINELLKYNLL